MSLFSRLGNWVTESLCNLPTVTRLECGRARIGAESFCLLSCSRSQYCPRFCGNSRKSKHFHATINSTNTCEYYASGPRTSTEDEEMDGLVPAVKSLMRVFQPLNTAVRKLHHHSSRPPGTSNKWCLDTTHHGEAAWPVMRSPSTAVSSTQAASAASQAC